MGSEPPERSERSTLVALASRGWQALPKTARPYGMSNLLLLPLLLGGAAPAVSVSQAALASAEDDYASLTAAYAAALEEHTEAVRAAKGLKAKRELRSNHPAHSYWPRFEALSRTDGRGYLWRVQNLGEKGLSRKERSVEAPRLYEVLVKDHPGASWFADVLSQLERDKRIVGEALYSRAHRAVIEANKHDAVRAQAMFTLAKLLLLADDEAARQEGSELFDRLVAELGDTPHGRLAAEELFEIKHLGIGCESPDFEASTIDGHEFKLSDYRGKVVLLDFYGFW